MRHLKSLEPCGEKICTMAGDEFVSLDGTLMRINQAWYGIKSTSAELIAARIAMENVKALHKIFYGLVFLLMGQLTCSTTMIVL